MRLCSQPPWSRCTPPSSPPTHYSPMRIPSSTITGWWVKNWTFLACVSLCTGHVLNFLTTRWARAFRTSRNVGCRLYLHRPRRTWRERQSCIVARCARKMLVTCLFSPNKLVDYFPVLRPARVNVHVSTRYLHTSVKQTRNLRPTSISFIEKAPHLDNQWARLGAAKDNTRGLSSSSIANLLSLYGGSA